MTRGGVCTRFARRIAAFVATTLVTATVALAADVYLAPASFLETAFDGDVPPAQRLWLTAPVKAPVRDILGHDLGSLRIRYWQRDERTAWILEEIGKDQPITTGLVVDAGHLSDVQVLIYRESRGWEVRYPAFTDQFKGAVLNEGMRLDRHIDGITGATMSVDALTRLARLALYFHTRTDT
jgi:hypothetical protein